MTSIITPIPSNKTYTDLYGDHKNNVVVFGNDANDKDFEADVKFEFWGEEWLSICEEGLKGAEVFGDNKISLETPKKTIEWYQEEKVLGYHKRDQFQSRLKWIIRFKKKPISKEYSFKLTNHERYNIRQNAPLQDIEHFEVDGIKYVRGFCPVEKTIAVCLEEANGCYTVYHKWKKNHVIGQKNYRTGKVMSIYLPYITDGIKGAYCSLHIENGIYTATIPDEIYKDKNFQWEKSHINDTFGYATIGDNTVQLLADRVIASGLDSPVNNGTATGIFIYCNSTSNTRDFRVGLYEDNSGPGALVGNEKETSNPGLWVPEWHEFATNSLSVVSSKSYWCAWQLSEASGDDFYYDTPGGTNRYYDDLAYGVWDNPYGQDSSSGSLYSTYCEYTPSGVVGQLLMHPGNDGLGNYQFDNAMNGGFNA